MSTTESMSALRRRWPLVGRDPVMARLEESLHHPRSRGAAVDVVVVCGPSGAGKTRIMEDFLATLEQAHGARDRTTVVRVVASRAAAAIPLAALADVLADELTEDSADAQRRSAPGEGAAGRSVAVLVADTQRSLAGRAGQGRLLIAVDDLSWLDPMSVLVLSSLVTSGAARMVATARDDEPLPDAVTTWWTSGRALRLDVGPLEIDQVAALLEQVLDGPVSPPTVAALHRASEGLPLFLRELAAGAVESGDLLEAAGVWRLDDELAPMVPATGGLRDLLWSRLEAQTPPDRELLDRLAVCTTLRLSEFPTDVTDQVIHLEATGLIETVDPRDPDPLLRVAHPQLIAVLRERLPRLQARRLLLEHAALVESNPTGRDESARTAQWRLEATGTGDPELLLRAGHLALAAHDHPSAERLAEAALVPLRHGSVASPNADESTIVAAHLLLARARWETVRPAAVLTTLDELARADDVGPAGPDVAVLRAAALAADPARLDVALQTLEPVRHALRVGERPDLVASVAALLLELDHAGDAAEIVDHHVGHHAERGASDGGASAWASLSAVYGASFTTVAARVRLEVGQVTEAVRHAEDAVGHARTAPTFARDALLADALAARAKVLLEGEFDPDLALRTAREALTAAVNARAPRAVYEAEWTLARASNLTGDQAGSSRWSSYVVSDGLAGLHGLHRQLGLIGVAFNAAEAGDTEKLRETLAEIDTTSPHLDQLPWNTRVSALERLVLHGDRRGAIDIIRRRAEAAERRGALLGAANDWFELAALARDEAVTREAASHLGAIAERCDSPLIQLYTDEVAARAVRDLTALATVIDRWEGRHGMFYARRAAVEAVRIAREDGPTRRATALTARFESIARRCPQIVHPPLDQPAHTPLTRREREIAELAAADNTNSDIAAALVLSVRTVENHLARAYTKLGVTSRTELSDALHG